MLDEEPTSNRRRKILLKNNCSVVLCFFLFNHSSFRVNKLYGWISSEAIVQNIQTIINFFFVWWLKFCALRSLFRCAHTHSFFIRTFTHNTNNFILRNICEIMWQAAYKEQRDRRLRCSIKYTKVCVVECILCASRRWSSRVLEYWFFFLYFG